MLLRGTPVPVDRAAPSTHTVRLPCTCARRCTDATSRLEQTHLQPQCYLRSASWSSARPRGVTVPRSAADRQGGGVEPLVLAQPTAQQLGEQTQRLARQVTAWLDDEWLPQDVHRDLGSAAAEVRAPAHAGSHEQRVTWMRLDATAPSRNEPQRPSD
jgi:hypothetical protein